MGSPNPDDDEGGTTPDDSWFDWEYFGSLFADFFNALASAISTASNTIVQWLGSVVNSIGNLGSDIGDWFSNTITSLANGFVNMGNWLSDVFDSITDLPSAFGDWFIDTLDDWFTPSQSFGDSLTSVPIVSAFYDVSEVFNQGQKQFDLNVKVLGKTYPIVNHDFINQFRNTVRNGLRTVFIIGTLIAIFRSFMGILNISVGIGSTDFSVGMFPGQVEHKPGMKVKAIDN